MHGNLKAKGNFMGEKKKKTKKLLSAKKRDIQNVKRNLINRVFKSKTKTALKSLDEAIKKQDSALIKVAESSLYSAMDKGVKRGVYSQNKAARTKSQITKKISKLATV